MMRWRLSDNGAILIYLILLSGVIGVLVAWRMLPREASSIAVYDLGGREAARYARGGPDDTLRYHLDETQLRVFFNGVLHVHPMGNVRNVDIRP
jgi:hypothetical protein